MDTSQWPQGIGVVTKPMEGSSSTTSRAMLERRATRPQKDQALNCPRCNSTNTKFCYYNNYSLTQPRYFCKTCRRYWTEGGSLRNVPVGGGSRKNKRSSSTNSTPPPPPPPPSSPSKLKLPHHHHDDHHHLTQLPSFSQSTSQNPKLIHEGQDLNLAYPPSHEDYNKNPTTNTSSSTSSHFPAMEFLKTSTGFNSRGLNSFMPMPVSQDSNTIYSSGFPLQDFKPTLNFSLDGFESGYGTLQGVQQNSAARLLFPFEDLKQVSSTTTDFEQNRGQGDSSGGYWNGMLGGGSW